MHLPQTLPENGGKGLQFGQGGELVFLFGEATHQLVPHRPFQGVPGPLPGITTAGNVPLQNHQGVLLAIGGSASHFAEQRRYGGELPPGQETAHFGFRVHTRHDLADDLEHHALADQHRGIGLLGGQSLNLFLRQILRVEVWGWQEGNLLRAGIQHLPLAHGGQHLPGESGEGCCVGQQPQPRAPTQSRHGEGSRCLAGVLVRFLHRQIPQRQLVVAVPCLQLTEYAGRGVSAEGDGVQQAHSVIGVTGEPAPLGQPLGQGFLLQDLTAGRVEQLRQIALDHQGRQLGHLLHRLHVPRRHLTFIGQHEPVEAVGRQGQQIMQLTYRRKAAAPEHLHRHLAGPGRQIQLRGLGRAGQVGHAEYDFPVTLGGGVFAQVGENPAIGRRQHLQRSPTEGLVLLAHAEHPPRPVQQGVRVAYLRLDIDRVIAVQGVHDRRQHHARRVRPGEAAIAVDRPLHGCTYAVPVAEKDIVAHADLVAVVQGRGTRHRQQQTVEQLDAPAITLHQRRQAAADPQVDARPAVGRIVVPQVVALLLGNHLQGQLVMVAQEDRPLAVVGNRRGLAQDIGDREAVFLGDGHVHARHQREVKGHVTFITRAAILPAEIGLGVLRPLIGLGQQHAVRIQPVQLGADLLQYHVGFRQILVVGAVALDQVGNGVQPHAVHAHVQPEAHYREHRLEYPGIVEIQIRLVRVEPVPEELPGNRVPGPVGLFGIEKDDPRALVLLIGIRPDVEIPLPGSPGRLTGTLEPGMLVRGMVDHQLGDDPQPATMGFADEAAHVRHVAVIGVHTAIVCNVVTVVAPR